MKKTNRPNELETRFLLVRSNFFQEFHASISNTKESSKFYIFQRMSSIEKSQRLSSIEAKQINKSYLKQTDTLT